MKNNVLLKNGEEFINEYIQCINEAKKYILLQTYIFNYDEQSIPIIEALEKAHTRKVKVFILIDAFGSQNFPDEILHRWAVKGIHAAKFAPLIHLFKYNLIRRLHSKVLVVDGIKTIVGGINIGSLFWNKDNPWLDYSVLTYGGHVSSILQRIAPLYQKYFKNHPYLPQIFTRPKISIVMDANIKVRINDWAHFKNEIHKSHLINIRLAKKNIVIIGTYFLPGKKILNELVRAKRRGVNVAIIFGAESDVALEKFASQYLYPLYLNAGINVLQWKKSVVHGKVFLFDDETVSIGSYNHNYLSRYFNHELNLEIWDKPFAKSLSQELQTIMDQCEKITMKSWDKTSNILIRIFNTFIYYFSNIVFIFALIFTIQKRESSKNHLP